MPTTGKHNGAHEAKSYRLRNARGDFAAASEDLIGAAERAGFPSAACFAIRLAVEEAVSNAFRHGHRSLPQETEVAFSWSVDPDRVAVTVEDQGPGFDFTAIPDPTVEENLEKASGRGVHLMRAFMTSVEYNERGNRVTMIFDRPRQP